MPWTKSDAKHKTHKADTAKKQRQWSHIANAALASGDSEASAIKQANAVIARTKKRLDKVFRGKK
jgi:uncharacterized protein YdaT